MNIFQSHRALAAATLLSAATLAPCRDAVVTAPAAMPPIKHVFVIMLENEGFDTTFAPTTRATYLADTLVKQGALLRQYYGIGHFSLDNYIAMISGMPATAMTQIDCPQFVDFVQTGTSADGQPVGTGCVYPAAVKTIANQLDARAYTWRGYMEDMGANATREAATCGHPTIGRPDSTEWATPNDQYATKHNPFMYFHAVIDSPSCKRRVVPLPVLFDDLKSASTTPNFSYITPNLCHDGHDHPCVNGEPGGLESANLFLKHWVPIIMNSPAFRDDGLLIITFDEALSHRPDVVLRPGAPGRTPASRTTDSSAADASAPCCCRGSSRRARCRTCPTTTIRCSEASRTSSASATSATRSPMDSRHSVMTSSVRSRRVPQSRRDRRRETPTSGI